MMTLEDKSKIYIKNNRINLLENFSLKPYNTDIIDFEFLKVHNKIINLFVKSEYQENDFNLDNLEYLGYNYKLTIKLYCINNKYGPGRVFDGSYQFHRMTLSIIGDEFTAFNKDVYIPLYINLELCEDGLDNEDYYKNEWLKHFEII